MMLKPFGGFLISSESFFYIRISKNIVFIRKKCNFYSYVVFLEDVCIKNKGIERVCDLLVPQSILDIHVFLGFANFYLQFIYSFSRIATLVIFILQTTSGLTANKLISTKDSINQVDGGKMIIEADVVSKKSRT